MSHQGRCNDESHVTTLFSSGAGEIHVGSRIVLRTDNALCPSRFSSGDARSELNRGVCLDDKENEEVEHESVQDGDEHKKEGARQYFLDVWKARTQKSRRAEGSRTTSEVRGDIESTFIVTSQSCDVGSAGNRIGRPIVGRDNTILEAVVF